MVDLTKKQKDEYVRAGVREARRLGYTSLDKSAVIEAALRMMILDVEQTALAPVVAHVDVTVEHWEMIAVAAQAAAQPPKTDYTREELIELCGRGVRMGVAHWHNRDSHRATIQLGELWALLNAGCKFEIVVRDGDGISTDHDTIWVRIYDIRGFNAFEEGDEYLEDTTRYCPTARRIEANVGGDWY